jgi:predicted ATPase
MLLDRLSRFIGDLKRRGVFQVAVAYGVVAWVVVEVAATTFPLLHIPEFAATVVVVIAAAGFPVAIVIAWIYDLEPTGILRTGSVGSLVASPPTEGESAAAPESAMGEPVSAVRQQIPVPLTPLVGRERERAEIERLLTDRTTRLVTILGPGGIGKTRLVTEVARESCGSYRDGVAFVALAELPDGATLAPPLADALGIPAAGGETPVARLHAFLRSKHLLLVLDNFEHLVPQAPAVAEILSAAPEVTVLCTSRERLRVRGETVVTLAGLEYPDDASAEESPGSVELFMQAARRVEPAIRFDEEDRGSIARICRFVEGVPLAIELAAAWVGVLSCAEIAAEIERNHDFLFGSLRDLPERQRSLRAVFEASWRLLPEGERATLRRLSIFQGGFGRAAAEAVADARVQTLSALVAKSLLRRAEDGRFGSLEIVRQFAREHLAADPVEEGATAERHARFFVTALAEAAPRLRQADGAGILAELARDSANLRTAWAWTVRAGRLEEIDRGLDGLYELYTGRGWMREGFETLGSACRELETTGSSLEPGGMPRRVRCRLLARQGVMALQLGDHTVAERLLKEALDLARTPDLAAEEAFALLHLGILDTFQGRPEQGRERHQGALAIYEELQDAGGQARARLQLGAVAYMLGDRETARRYFQEGLTAFRALGWRRETSMALKNLGAVEFDENRLDEANRLLLESLPLDRASGNVLAIANVYQNLGCVARRAGEVDRAEEYLREGARISERWGFRRIEGYCLNELGIVSRDAGDLQEANEHHRRALALASEIRHMPLILEALLGFAELRARQGEQTEAARLVSTLLAQPILQGRSRERTLGLAGQLGVPAPDTQQSDAARPGSPTDLDAAVRALLLEPQSVPAAI